ncbi:hypothetical protein M6D81_21470 [Paenibacillus sp. J5C_2022]|uniref:hypothetical protein n=1 Tax=Paenibacillus sp. J5C2022 TaxID=2977129 RepID=UPI0021D1A6A7|nr:hypothetical protein [Paenibacillus sp. J5C2022]MCU6711266.1 hypothetical protein [Paenibacillus sp. J5C2022]
MNQQLYPGGGNRQHRQSRAARPQEAQPGHGSALRQPPYNQPSHDYHQLMEQYQFVPSSYYHQGHHVQGTSYPPHAWGNGNYGNHARSAPPQAHISSQNTSEPHLLPAVVPQSSSQLAETPPRPPSSSGGFSLANLTKMANLSEIKGFVDRMGGLDGILSTVTKMQKVVTGVSQMAPMVKVLFGSFGKKSISQDDENNSGSGAKRRRRRRSGSTRKKSGTAQRRRRRSGSRRK